MQLFTYSEYNYVHDRDDASAVAIVVKSWSARGDDSPIRYYKHVGENNYDTQPGRQSRFDTKDFLPEDFLLVMQSPQQALMLAENPRTLCVDATHGVTGYGYYLLTILVIDKQGSGLPVGWAIASRENAYVWYLFSKSLREEALAAKPEVIMSDDSNSAWNGLRATWSSIKHKLLCHWHIKRNVKLHCVGSKSRIKVLNKEHIMNIL